MNEDTYYNNVYDYALGRQRQTSVPNLIVKGGALAIVNGLTIASASVAFTPVAVLAGSLVLTGLFTGGGADFLDALRSKLKLDSLCNNINSVIKKKPLKESFQKLLNCNHDDKIHVGVRYPNSPEYAFKSFDITQHLDPDDAIQYCLFVTKKGEKEPYQCYEISGQSKASTDTRLGVISYEDIMDMCLQEKPNEKISDDDFKKMRDQFNLVQLVENAFNKDARRKKINSTTKKREFNDVTLDGLKAAFDYTGGYSYHFNNKFGLHFKQKYQHFQKLAKTMNPDPTAQQTVSAGNSQGQANVVKPNAYQSDKNRGPQTIIPPQNNTPNPTSPPPAATQPAGSSNQDKYLELENFVMEKLEDEEWDYKFCKTVGEMFGVTAAEVKHMVFKVYDDNKQLQQINNNNVGGRTM